MTASTHFTRTRSLTPAGAALADLIGRWADYRDGKGGTFTDDEFAKLERMAQASGNAAAVEAVRTASKPVARVAPLFAGYASAWGFCRLCGHGFALTPTYGNPARCPACDVFMGGPGDVGRPARDEVAA